jgi:chromosomal replication initiator protein
MIQVWEEIKAVLKDKISEESYRVWIAPLSYERSDHDTIVINCPNQFYASWIQRQYLPLVSDHLHTHGQKWKIELRPEEKVRHSARHQLHLPKFSPSELPRPTLCANFTFEEFVVGESNQLAYSACKAAGYGEKRGHGNIIFLHSSPGLGKSHLVQPAGHAIYEQSPEQRLCYLTANEFTSQVVKAIRKKEMDDFKRRYHNECDVLLLEHTHNLAGRERTQTELASILDSMLEQGKTVIFTGNTFPREIEGINDALRSRLGSALITYINPPEFNTRRRIVERKAKRQGFIFDEEVIELLASNITGDIRKIESAVVGLIAKSSFMKRPVNIELAKEVLHEIVGEPAELTVTTIRELICRHFGLSVEELRSRSRKKSITWPRQVGMYLCRRYTDASLESIGKEFNRDHATVQHSVKKISKEFAGKGKARKQLEYLVDQIEKQQWK